MSDVDFDSALEGLRKRVEPLAEIVHGLARILEAPQFERKYQGFRYREPDVHHFCMLKAARAVSALSAALELARCGFSQEIFVLIRTLVECTTHIEYVLSGYRDDGGLEEEVSKYVHAYFDDFERGGGVMNFKRAQVKQITIHKRLGAELDSLAERADPEVRAETLYSNIYRSSSGYVHAKYPEVMDLYGGIPGHFHLQGMRGTPKDSENLEVIDSYLTTVSVTLKLVLIKLKLHALILNDSDLANWYRSI